MARTMSSVGGLFKKHDEAINKRIELTGAEFQAQHEDLAEQLRRQRELATEKENEQFFSISFIDLFIVGTLAKPSD